MTKKQKFDDLIQRIEVVRTQSDQYNIINIVAVSKYSDTQDIQDFYDLGQRTFGENKVQDLKAKSDELIDLPLSWHFIGRLQKNKINQLIDLNPTLTHSLDSLELATELNKRLAAKDKTMNTLLQINSSNEISKAGVSIDKARDIYQEIKETCPNIKLKGVMSFGANTDNHKLIQKTFENTYKIYESLKTEGAKFCSMGMSNDFELAINCGSNMIRVGSVLFK
ncbi:MAG: Hypothetical protein YggS, proline synthase co-transcribed bacterial homolog PROSC [uncultured Campylobacterales bacterium]|uniref:Pyridoxal phosphate homeostasis protein n=1 Tax=uncultured Campylobacterales bacterium TaxID=352960 RepID=A0A6S6SQL0_9BACT|nr:MAG: Hypothetical protein YggS, proline synthase co-transcribed bacterial homolog PROSC [uncultured Campylobacterales bacterium]